MAEVAARVDRVIDRVRATPGDVVCVAHSHLLRVLAARWVGLDAEAGAIFTLAPATISVLGWERDDWRVALRGDVFRTKTHNTFGPSPALRWISTRKRCTRANGRCG